MKSLTYLDKQNLDSYNLNSVLRSRWEDFLFSEVSSIYSDRVIKSSNYAIIYKAVAKILSSIDYYSNKSVDNMNINRTSLDLVYTNFGYLLRDKPENFSADQYRIFIKALSFALLKGLSINYSVNNLISDLGFSPDISIYKNRFSKNNTFDSVGLNHINALTNTNSFLGLKTNHVSSKNSIEESINDNKKFYLMYYPESGYSLDIRDLSIVSEIIDIMKSAGDISYTGILLRDTIKKLGKTTLIECRQSIDNFVILDYYARYFPNFTLFFETNYLSFYDDYTPLTNVDDSLFYVEVDHTLFSGDYWNILPSELYRVSENLISGDFIIGGYSSGVVDSYSVEGVSSTFSENSIVGEVYIGNYNDWNLI